MSYPINDDSTPITPLDPQNGEGNYSDNEQSETFSGDYDNRIVSNTGLTSTDPYEGRVVPEKDDWFPIPEYEPGDEGVITDVTHSDFDHTFTVTISWSGGGTQQVVIAEDEYLDRVSAGESLEEGQFVHLPATDTSDPDYHGPQPDPDLVIETGEVDIDVNDYGDNNSDPGDDPPSEPEYEPSEELDHNPYLD